MPVSRMHPQPERKTCTVTEFGDRHNLCADEASRLYEKFGPFTSDLDALMTAKRQRAQSKI